VIVTGALVYKHIGYVPSFEHFGRIMFSGALMIAAFMFLPKDSFFVTGFIASVTYVATLACVKAINLREVKSIFASSEPVVFE
jgi:hypothetical protein